ncbi:PTS sugar transporter subunit IIB [Halanaerocella petrolearia]
MAKKKIMVACGAGVATSTVVTGKVEEICEKNGIDAKIRKGKIVEVPTDEGELDLLVSTTVVDEDDYPFPVINGKNFLTGVGIEETTQEILDVLNK